MRWTIVLACVLGCSDNSVPATPDGSIDAPDVMPDAATLCTKRVGFTTAGGVHDIAIDGTAALAAIQNGGSWSVLAVPLDGGAPSTIATSATLTVVVSSHAGVATYAIATASGIEIRRRDGSVLNTVAGQLPFAMHMNATDVYLLAQGANGKQLWRIPRAGTTPVAIANVAPAVLSFALGTSVAAFNVDTQLYTVPIPGGGTATPVANEVGQLDFVGDAGFITRETAITATKTQYRIERFQPAAGQVLTSTIDDGFLTTFADDRYLYYAVGYTTAGMHQGLPYVTSVDPVTLAKQVNPICADFMQGRAYDATNLYGVEKTGSTSWQLLVTPRAP